MSIGNLNQNNYSDSSGKYKFKQVWGGREVDEGGIKKEATWNQLEELASQMTGEGTGVSPAQLAAILLERAVETLAHTRGNPSTA